MAVVDQLVFFWVSTQYSRWVFLLYKGTDCLHVQGDRFWFLWMLKWLGKEQSRTWQLVCWPAKLCLRLSPVRTHDHTLVHVLALAVFFPFCVWGLLFYRRRGLTLNLVVLLFPPHTNPQKILTMLLKCLDTVIHTYTHTHMHSCMQYSTLYHCPHEPESSHIGTLIHSTAQKEKRQSTEC